MDAVPFAVGDDATWRASTSGSGRGDLGAAAVALVVAGGGTWVVNRVELGATGAAA